DHLARHTMLLSDFAGAQCRVDAVGHDGFVALDALVRRRHVPVELHAARTDLLASHATAFAIGQSAAAQEAMLRSVNAGDQDQHQTPAISVQGAERRYLALGFTKSRSTLLAHAAVSWHSAALLDARWAVLDRSDDDARGRTFESLLCFIGAAPLQRR